MRVLIRRIRAALVVSAAWAVAWGTVGLLAGVVDGVQSGQYPGYPDVEHWWLSPFYLLSRFGAAAVIGAVSGLVFAAVVAVAERGRTTWSLSLKRTAAWGAAVSGGLFTLSWHAFERFAGAGFSSSPFPLGQLALATLGGAGLATLTLWVARRSDTGTDEPPTSGVAGPPSASLRPGEMPAQPARQAHGVPVT